MWVKNALEAVNPDIVRKSICISRIDLNPDGSEDDKISGNRDNYVVAGAKEEIGWTDHIMQAEDNSDLFAELWRWTR